jgi:hypothetical protein
MRSIAEIISKERDVKILSVNHDILLSRYVGEGENKLRELFKTAHRWVDGYCIDMVNKIRTKWWKWKLVKMEILRSIFLLLCLFSLPAPPRILLLLLLRLLPFLLLYLACDETAVMADINVLSSSEDTQFDDSEALYTTIPHLIPYLLFPSLSP